MPNQQMYGGYYPNNQNWQSPPSQTLPAAHPQFIQQVQNMGYIPVPNEDMARNYPVAPGNSLAFRSEDGNYMYVKSMGFSQYDKPVFDKYELVNEPLNIKESEPVMEEPVAARDYDSEIDALGEELNSIREEVEHLKKQQVKIPYKQPKRKENEEK